MGELKAAMAEKETDMKAEFKAERDSERAEFKSRESKLGAERESERAEFKAAVSVLRDQMAEELREARAATKAALQAKDEIIVEKDLRIARLTDKLISQM